MITHSPQPSYYHQKSERLIFRPLTLDDVSAWIPFFTHNAALRFVGAGADDASPSEKATKWISRQLERAEKGEFGQLAVCLADGTFIGVGGLISREMAGAFDLEIGYSLLQKHQGFGYATELARLFKEYAWKETGLDSVISIIHVENEASMNVATKNGMHRDEETLFMEMPVYIYRIKR